MNRTSHPIQNAIKWQLDQRRLGSRLARLMALPLGAALLMAANPAPRDELSEARLQKMEAEIRALQRKAFSIDDGRIFTPEFTNAPTSRTAIGRPASGPQQDLSLRLESAENQVASLIVRLGRTNGRISQLEDRIGSMKQAATQELAPQIAMKTSASGTGYVRPSQSQGGTSTAPSAQRLASVQAVVKPRTSDPADDDYSYGFRLWQAKLYPEARQQLKMFIARYARHDRVSFARNLLGRAYLDEGKPREAATWFLDNYRSQKYGARAPDSLLFLSAAMHRLKDDKRACIALAEFSEFYAREAAGRLKGQYDTIRSEVHCRLAPAMDSRRRP